MHHDDKVIVPRGQQGHIYVRSLTRFQGYMNDAENTALVLNVSGWFNTHDTGRITEN